MDSSSAIENRKSSSTGSRMRSLGALRPDYAFGFRLPTHHPGALVEVLPFRKYWLAIVIMAGLTAGFVTPLFTLPFNLGGAEDLFDLTTSLFTLFWALGWSVGVLFLFAIVLALLFAREVMIVEPERLILRLEIFRFGMQSSHPLSCLSNLRFLEEAVSKGNTWRKGNLAVDYLNIPVSFGSNLDHQQAARLIHRINATLAHPLPATLPADMQAQLDTNIPLPDPVQSHVAKVAAPVENQQASVSPEADTSRQPRLSLLFLLGANLVPLAGVLTLGWDIGDIMLLFWLESAIVGFFNILKMFRIAGAMAVFYSILFLAHYGAFMAVHLMFIFGLFIEEQASSTSLNQVVIIFTNLWVAILALFISHGFSYMENFLRKQEYQRLDIKTQMHKPYARIITMHITIIFGGFLVLVLNAPVLALCLLIVLKMTADGVAHLKEHKVD